MKPPSFASLSDGLLELVFLALDPPDRLWVDAVCRRWRYVSRSSAAMWDAASWKGSTDSTQQIASLGSFLAWICSRVLPPRQLHLHLRMDMETVWLPLLAVASTWVHLGTVVARCSPHLQRLTIVQDYPGVHGLAAVDEHVLAMCVPVLGAWLLPCTQLQRLKVTAPLVVLAPRVLQSLPALQHLELRANMTLYGEGGAVQLQKALPQNLASSSLTSLDLFQSDWQLQAGVLAGLPRLRRLVAGNLQFPFAEGAVPEGHEDFALLADCAGSLEELQLHSYKQVVPPQLSRLTGLRRLLFAGLDDGTSLQAADQLGQALAHLPRLEALSLAGNWSLASPEHQQRLWAAWQPAPQHLRSLEVQCGAADHLPPAAAPHLANLHILFCDWGAVRSSPGALAGCSQLRQLHILVNGPPHPDGRPRPLPAVPPSVVLELVSHLAAMHHLTHLQLFNFQPSSDPDNEPPPVPASALELLAEAAARLPPGVRIPPVRPVQHPHVHLGLWAAS